jgi:hypothetical protein
MKKLGYDKKRTGKRLSTFFLICLLSISYAYGQVDYGYLLSEDAGTTVWWAEGAYKVKKGDPVPKIKRAGVSLECARNEYEPFLLVLRPNKRMDMVRIEASPFSGPNGCKIPSSDISICHVGYVNVLVPTDKYAAAGPWPDPLPPYEGPFAACPGENHPLWITVYVPRDAEPGEYRGGFTLSCGTWKKEIPVALKVWGFALPEETHIRSSFGLFTGDIRRYHNLETQEELEKVFDLYLQNMKEHRLSPTSALALYPMKVKVRGLSWRGGELVSDIVHSGKRGLKVEDDSTGANVEAVSEDPIPG